MKELWNFQKPAFEDCKNFLWGDNKKDSGIAVLPTGAGKSVILAHLSSFASEDDPLLFVVPSVDLLRQNAEAIRAEGGEVGIYCGSINKKEIKNITVASVMSLNSDIQVFKEVGIKRVIVDECHFKASEKGIFKDFLDELKPKKLLGLTATAFKLTTYRGFNVLRTLDVLRPAIFKRFIHITQVGTVIENDRWSDIKYTAYKYDTTGLKENSSSTEFDKESIIEQNNNQQTNRHICAELKRLSKENKDYKILVFVDSVKTANIMRDWVNKNLSFNAEVISAETTQKNREQFILDFKDSFSDDVNVIINYGTLTTGFDYPGLTHVIMGRPTMSFSLYYQIVGRLVRKSESKVDCRFIDFCGNCERFGSIEGIVYKFISGFGWCVFSGDKLITGVPLISHIKVTEEFIKNPPKQHKIDNNLTLSFGKYASKPLRTIPKFYRDFLLTKFEWDFVNEHNVAIVNELKKLSENDFIKLFKT